MIEDLQKSLTEKFPNQTIVVQEQHGTGRLYLPDERDNDFLMRSAMEVPRALPRWRYYWVPTIFNQGTKPWCVDYSWNLFLRTSPIMQRGLPFGDIYCAAQKRDPWVGDCDNPQYDGTSVRAGAKYLQELGYVGEYLWAFNSTDVTNWLLSGKGPVVLGTRWYNSMFYPDEDGVVPVHPESGGAAGGHAYLVIGVNLNKGMVRIANSWGTEWGQNGRAWIKLTDLDKLLQQQGEACTAIEIRK